METDFMIEAVLANRANRVVLERLPALGLGHDAWLASGTVFQAVWNALTGRASDYGIRDCDVVYFDGDTSWEAEDAVIRRVLAATSDIAVPVEVRNQARVHLWYEKKFGTPCPPLRSATEGIDRFLVTVAQIGIRKRPGGFQIHAPRGVDDILTMTVRPNPASDVSMVHYEEKARAWKAKWPELTIVQAGAPD